MLRGQEGLACGVGNRRGKTEPRTEEILGEETPGNLPAVFADSLLGGTFLMKAHG